MKVDNDTTPHDHYKNQIRIATEYGEIWKTRADYNAARASIAEAAYDSALARLKEAMELIDGAKCFVEMWGATTPGQVRWKKHWLEKANEILEGE